MHNKKCYCTKFRGRIQDFRNAPYYSLIVDESTDISTMKHLCLCIKYYSQEKNQICNNFLGVFEVEGTSANELFIAITKFLKKLGLDIKYLIGIGTDGANNLCGCNRSLFKLLQAENPNIQLVRCVCHSLNNAASAAVDELPACVDFLCREIYNWFSNSPLRRLEYKRLFDIRNANEKSFHQFIKLSSTRWLCRYEAIRVVLENWNDLKLHFEVVVNKEKCYLARQLNEMLHDNSKLLLPEVNKVNLIFQKNEVEIGDAYKDLVNLSLFLARKIMKELFLTNGIDGVTKSLTNPLAYLKSNDCNFGIEYFQTISKVTITAEERTSIENKSFLYLKRLLEELCKRLPNHLNLFKNLSYFSPNIILSQTAQMICCDKFMITKAMYRKLTSEIYIQ